MKITNEPTPTGFRRVALYGPPKIGKTRLATSLPWGPIWGDKAIYCTWDPDSASLDPILPHHREHLILAEPVAKVLPNGKEVFDPLDEAVKMATYPWTQEFPGARTLIWDTMTETSRRLLHAYADTGQFSEKHLTFGTPGSKSFHAAPMEGDYGAAQRSALFIIEHLFNLPMNLIVLFHDEFAEPKKGADPRVGGLFGGPGIMGKAGIRQVAGRFNNLFRISIEPSKADGRIMPAYVVHTQQTGGDIWLTGIRLPAPTNPIPRLVLNSDPVNFWEAFDSALGHDSRSGSPLATGATK